MLTRLRFSALIISDLPVAESIPSPINEKTANAAIGIINPMIIPSQKESFRKKFIFVKFLIPNVSFRQYVHERLNQIERGEPIRNCLLKPIRRYLLCHLS